MMKRTLLAGLLMIGLTAQAATGPKLTVEVDKYLKEKVNPHLFGKEGSAKGFANSAVKMFEDKIVRGLDVDATAASGIKSALTVGGTNTPEVVERRLANLAELLAAREVANSAIKQGLNVEEATSLKAASRAMAKTISNFAYKGDGRTSTLLNTAELKLATEAITKMEEIAGQVTKMDRESRDLFTEVESKRAELLDTTAISGEEALLQAIMKVKNCSKEKALQIMERLKKCV